MTILIPALKSDKKILKELLCVYLEELSQYHETDTDYAYLDTYWQTDQRRWPYLIRSETQTVGFILVNAWSPSGQGTDFAMAEFYITPKARKNGLGQQAANAAFSAHPDQWELSVVRANTGVRAFWSRVLDQTNASQITHGSETIFRFYI